MKLEASSQIFLLLSLIFLFISFIFLSFILFFIYRNKKCKIKNEELKKEFNELTLYDFERINLPIDHISFSDKKFENIMYLFNDFSEVYRNKINEIKEKIFKIPKILDNFDWKSFFAYYKSIKAELTLLNSKIHSLFNIKSNILSYKNYISKIIVNYRENSWELVNFYNSILASEIKNVKNIFNIKKQINELKEASINFNECIEKYDLNLIDSCLTNLNDKFFCLWNTINKVYIEIKQSNYINFSINEVKNILNKNFNTFESNIINEAQKKITLVEQNLSFLKEKGNKLKDIENQQITLALVKTLSEVKLNLNISYKSNEFFNKNKSTIDKTFFIVKSFVPNLIKIFKKIYNNFIDDKNIKDDILNCINEFKEILKFISNYSKLLEKTVYDPYDLFEVAKKIIEKIVRNNSNSNNLINEIIKKYSYSKEIINDLTSYRLLIVQLKSYIYKNNLETNIEIKLLDDLLFELNKIEKIFFLKKIENNLKNENVLYSIESLSEIKFKILEIKEKVLKVQLFKAYTEKILGYACLKIYLNNDKNNFKFDKVIDFYNKRKYKESILCITRQIKKQFNPYKKIWKK